MPVWLILRAMRELGWALCLAALCASAHASELQPFTTDGCSDFPDGTPSQKTLWLDCCVAHDRAYWLGGTYEERREADQALERCVAAVGEPTIAKLMLAGVRVGGSPYWPTRFRWGYGWPWGRGYQVVSVEERLEAERLMALDTAQK